MGELNRYNLGYFQVDTPAEIIQIYADQTAQLRAELQRVAEQLARTQLLYGSVSVDWNEELRRIQSKMPAKSKRIMTMKPITYRIEGFCGHA